MFSDRIEAKWIAAFQEVFKLCKITSGDAVAILSETQSRQLNVQLAELALLDLGARAFHIVVPTPAQTVSVPVRSTGASDAIQRLSPVIGALGDCVMVVDLTLEGLLHAIELPQILKGGARVLMISNEHPEALERLLPDPALTTKVKHGIKMARAAQQMHVKSDAGTNLSINLADAVSAGVWGYCDRAGSVAHWPGGLVVNFPSAGSVNGNLVMDAGDINLTFKRYLEQPVNLIIENDYVTRIEGSGTDAELVRRYFAAWNDPDAYAVSHVGWGMNPSARYEAMAFYDKRDFNGTELRAFAGNFLYSTGANEIAGRHTLGHFDLPVRGCTISLDDQLIVRNGELQGDLA